MQYSFVLAALAALTVSSGAVRTNITERGATAHPQDVGELMQTMKAVEHGKFRLTEDGKLESLDKDGKVVDSTDLETQAVDNALKMMEAMEDEPVKRDVSAAPRHDEGEIFKRRCTAYPCDQREDCWAYNCYGGCLTSTSTSYTRCWP
ncbi:hypothetical protein F4778DRAFT_781012 [Xylariomycetidae sp. FL2044]|nr:hypothetical protein F4778DRAFT_781012 [Xylariomycetidae sp. FL2044]